MIRVLALGLLLSGLLGLQGAAWGAGASPHTAPFVAAAMGTAIGNDAAQAYFLVSLLRRAEASKDDVEALRRELLHSYLAQLTGTAVPPLPSSAPARSGGMWDSLRQLLPGRSGPPPDTLGAAIARGRQRPGVLEEPFRSAWRSAVDQGLAVRWGAGEGRTPYFLLEMRDLEPIAPGMWAAPTASGRVRLVLALRLTNTAALPLPVLRPDLVLGGTAAGASGGLGFACRWDRAPRRESEMQASEVTLLAPGAESEPLACEAQPADASWREQAPRLAAARPLLVTHELDSASRLSSFELALARSTPQADEWSRRLQLAWQQTSSQWKAGARPLQPPEQPRWTSSAPHQGWRSSGESLKLFLGSTVLALGLFAAGRTMIRLGVPRGGVAGVTLLAGAGLFALAMLQFRGGTGYGHPLIMGTVLWAGYFGPMLLSVLGLHWLHKLLDEEEIEWWETVATGWRRMFDVASPTSRAQFWGFLAHCAWIWLLARLCLQPLDLWIGAVLLVAVLTLTARRLRSMTQAQLLEMALVFVCFVLLALV